MPVSDQLPPIYQFQDSGTRSIGTKFTGPMSLVISDGTKTVVTLSFKDGSVTFGEGITPDGAAKAFWDNITRLYPSACAAQQAQ